MPNELIGAAVECKMAFTGVATRSVRAQPVETGKWAKLDEV